MSVIDDLANALETYPADNVTLSFTEVGVRDGTEGVVNVDEIWGFRVLVENDGRIDMNDVQLHVNGKNDTLVSTDPAGPFSDGLTTGPLTVNGDGGSQKSGFLYFRAPADRKPADTEMVGVHIANWSGSLDRLFAYHTNHAPGTNGIYTAQVHP